MSGQEEHRTSSEARRHVVTRPVTTSSHEAGVARYLGVQHYRERRIHEEEQETREEPDERDEQES